LSEHVELVFGTRITMQDSYIFYYMVSAPVQRKGHLPSEKNNKNVGKCCIKNVVMFQSQA